MSELKIDPTSDVREATGGEAAAIRAAGAPTTEAVIHPLVMIDDTKVLPRDYIIHRRSQRCLNCGTVHEWSDVYARNEVPPTHNLGRYVQNLVPIRGFRFNLPVRVVTIEARVVPACHECYDTLSLEAFPDPRESEEWKRIVKRKALQEAAAQPKVKAKTPKATPTLDSLKDLL